MALQQIECYKAAILFANTEGIIIAPETSHAVAAVIRKAKEAREEGKEKVILFNMSGHGLMDLNGYDAYLQGKLVDHELHQDEVDAALAELKGLPLPAVNRTGKW